MTLERGGQFRIRVSPELKEQVLGEDMEYLYSLLADFHTRAQSDSNSLFKQICKLGVGPLMLAAVGENIQSHPELAAQFDMFVEI